METSTSKVLEQITEKYALLAPHPYFHNTLVPSEDINLVKLGSTVVKRPALTMKSICIEL